MKWYALFSLTLLLSAVLAASCDMTASVERVVETTGVTESSGTQDEPVVKTTPSSPSESGATVGVASTTEQTEALSEEDSAEPSSGEAGQQVSQTPPFVADPQARGGAGYGADSILAVRYGIHEDYERVVIDLGTGQKPAGSVPEWILSSPTGDGVLRITLPSVNSTGVSDGTFSGPLLKSFYVVRDPEDGLFVDVFSESAFTYRVIGLLDPARLVIDFKPSGASLAAPLPARSGNTVLTEPRSGARVGGPLTVSGYSRNFEANNTVTLTTAAGDVLVQEIVMSNDWSSTWGYFETTLDLPPFEGQGILKAGARSARDGSFEGVEIPVYGS